MSAKRKTKPSERNYEFEQPLYLACTLDADEMPMAQSEWGVLANAQREVDEGRASLIIRAQRMKRKKGE